MSFVVTVGEAMLELRPEGGGFAASLAGDAFNTAARLAAAGHAVRHVQDVGLDPLVDRIREECTRRSVELVGRAHAGRSNGMYVVSVEPGGERRFQYFRAGSAAGESLLGPAGESHSAIASAELVYVTGVTLAISADPDRLLQRLQRAPGTLALGLNLRDGLHRRAADGTLHPVDAAAIVASLHALLPSARVVIGSAAELSQLADGASAERVAGDLATELAGRIVVVTDGARGAVAWHGTGVHRAAPPGSLRPVDTTGAGDALAAAFLGALLDGGPVDACLRAGVAAGTAAVLHAGALPSFSEV